MLHVSEVMNLVLQFSCIRMKMEYDKNIQIGAGLNTKHIGLHTDDYTNSKNHSS